VHFLNCLRSEEIKRLELGEATAPDEQLFDRSVFKSALPEVSKARLNGYLYAEHDDQRGYIEKLKGQKAEQTPESLMQTWGADRSEAIAIASALASLGFFEQRGSQAEPTFWVPFLYRDALGLIQGQADADAE
jgi:hypothetical protein